MLDQIAILQARHDLMLKVRTVFYERGFLEVTTPVLQEAPTLEPYVRNFETSFMGPLGETPTPVWLHGSPELDMKRLLAAGADRIFQLGPVFRQGDRSPLHTPEFTMLEWYEVGSGLDEAKALTLAVMAAAGGVARREELACDLSRAAEVITISKLIGRAFGFDPLDTIDPAESLSPRPDVIREALAPQGISLGEGASWQDYLHAALLSGPEAELGVDCPTILTGYPRCMGALAATSDNDPRCADRFEVYVCGTELANGYQELTDTSELRDRISAWSASNQPQPMAFLEAMDHGLPDSAGVALGFDRLLMLKLGAVAVKDVQPIPGPLS